MARISPGDPKYVDPLINLIIRELNRQGIGWKELSARTGIHRNTLQGWAGRGSKSYEYGQKVAREGSMTQVLYVLRVLGIELWPVRAENLPARHPDMDPIKEFHRESMLVFGYGEGNIDSPPPSINDMRRKRIKFLNRDSDKVLTPQKAALE